MSAAVPKPWRSGHCHDAPDLTGMHEAMPEPEYHGHRGSLSFSGAKVLLKAPALFRWQQDHPVHKKAFDFGSAAHALALGSGLDQIYVAPYDDWIKRKGPEGGVQYSTDEKRIAQEDGLSPILPKDWEIVCAMVDALAGHELAMRLLSDGRPEVSAFAVDPETGVLRRGRFDWLGERILSDYKTTDNADPLALPRTVAKFRYHMQAAWYLDLARDCGHPAEAFAFIFQEKEPPYLVSVIDIDEEALERGRQLNRRALQRFRDCSDSGIWPGYQRPGEFTTVSLPRWAFADDQEDIA